MVKPFKGAETTTACQPATISWQAEKGIGLPCRVNDNDV